MNGLNPSKVERSKRDEVVGLKKFVIDMNENGQKTTENQLSKLQYPSTLEWPNVWHQILIHLLCINIQDESFLI